MEKHLLVTVSNDSSCLYGARFVAAFFENKENLKVTLFYDSPVADPKFRASDFGSVAESRRAARAAREKGWKALESSQEVLCRKGLEKTCVNCHFSFKQFGTAKDIVREGNQGLYDAVVLGRRGYGLFETFLNTSITRELLDEDVAFPIWVCRPPEADRKNVLLCVDGSEPGLHIADHVGFVIKNQPQHTVTLFHIANGNDVKADQVLDEATAKVTDNEVSEDRIQRKVVRSNRVVNAIMEEYQRGRYAAIAVGRVGFQKKGMHQWLVGSSTKKLMEGLEHGALWINW